MTEKRTTKITKQQQYKYLSICLDRSFASAPSGARF